MRIPHAAASRRSASHTAAQTILLAAALAATALTTACRPAGNTATAPQTTTAVAETDSVDLGTLEPGTARTATYRIRNTGSHPLRIAEVLTSCDCTQADFDTGETAPGATATVRLTYRAEAFAGYVYRTAEVNANTDGPIALTLTATVADNE
ncbi:MAG: DUF1573 domain-containing protein [Clostridium sp.]|nr:DUF1573 domain-containing protein [Clostridium sp.]